VVIKRITGGRVTNEKLNGERLCGAQSARKNLKFLFQKISTWRQIEGRGKREGYDAVAQVERTTAAALEARLEPITTTRNNKKKITTYIVSVRSASAEAEAISKAPSKRAAASAVKVLIAMTWPAEN